MAGGYGGSSNNSSAIGGAGGAGYTGQAGTAGKGQGTAGSGDSGGTGGGGGAAGGGYGGAGGSAGGANGTTPGYAGGKGGTASHPNGYAGGGSGANGNITHGGGGGGGGGINAFVNATLNNAAGTNLTGGNGGNGGGSYASGGGGGGGAGGYGAVATGAGGSTNAGGLYGGTGGNGGAAGEGGGVGGPGAAGGGGGAGAAFSAVGAGFSNSAGGKIRGGNGGVGGSGTYGNENLGGGGRGGAGGAGTVFTKTGFDLGNTGTITGGTGGQGGALGAGSFSPAANGTGGTGGAGVSGAQGTINNTGRIYGGNGGPGGTGRGQLGSYGGNGGQGGDGIIGANLAITNTGTVGGGAGGAKGAGTPGVAGAAGNAIDLTGGTNSLTLGNATTTGTIAGGIGVGGTLSVDPGTAAGTNVTLSNVIHDYSATVAGTFVKAGAGTLTLTGANTYSNGTTLNAGTLDLDAATTLGTGGAITSGAAGKGGIAFGAAGPATLCVEAVAFNTSGTTSNLAYQLSNFAAGDVVDLTNLTPAGAAASYNGTTLTVSNTAGQTDTLSVTPAPSGFEYAVQSDGGTGTDVVLRAIPAPTIMAPTNGTDTNNNKPTLSGAGENGDTVDLSIALQGGTTTSATATVTNGAWSYTPTSALADGNYSVTAVETSPNGTGASTLSNTETFTVDTTAPAAPSTPSDASVKNGYVNAANDTAGQTVTGTAEAGSTVRVYDNGNLVDTTTANSTTGGWSYQVGTLPNGSQHSYTATATDAANNTSAMSPALAFTVDTTPPTITAVADSGSGIDINGNGDLGAGRAVTLTVTTSEAVTVTPGAGGTTPTLALNDGGTATYSGGSGTAQQTFSYTVAAGQNTAKLAVAQVNANGAMVTDAAGNPLNPSIMGAAVPSGTLVIDTAPPVVSSPTDTVAQNSSPAPIGIAAPNDNLTPVGSLAIAAGALPTDGTVTLANGQAVTTGEALTSAQLTGLLFTPTQDLSNQGSTFTYTVTDGAGNATTGTAALNIGSPGAPTIAGTHATTDQAEAPVVPFAGVTVSDPSNATEALTIQLTGQGGTLTGAGLTRAADGSYQLTGTAAQVTQQLDTLSFTPTAGASGTTTNTTFVLTDRSSAGTSVVDSGTSVADTAAAAPPPPPPVPTPDVVAFSPEVSYRDGVFMLTGTASSPAGVRAVEITAQVDGVATDLGAATVDANGTFSFSDAIGAHTQGFLTATETDGAGGTAAAQANYSLTGGLSGGKGRQDRYTADGSAVTATDVFKADGSQTAKVLQAGQTFASSFFDTFNNGGAPESTFVFDPGFGRDVVSLFRVDGADHDTLSFKGSNYGNSIATVLNSARNTNAGLLITDPVASSPGGGPGTHDTLLLKGITKQQLAQNQGDIAFHA